MENELELQKKIFDSKMEQILKRRIMQEEGAFQTKATKSSGSTKGYIAEKDGASYLIKFNKNPSSQNTRDYCAMGIVNELIMSPLYKAFMYGRTPYIMPVRPTQSDNIALASEFLPGNFQTLSEYTSSKTTNMLGPDYEKLKKLNVQGVEKLFATMLMLGEFDVHARNIGVMNETQNGVDVPVFAKIDHGWSATQFFTNAETALKNFKQIFEIYYKSFTKNEDEIESKNYLISININKFKEHINQICLIDQEEIDNLLEASWHALNKSKINIENLMMLEWQDDQLHSYNKDSLPPATIYDNFGGCPYYLVDKDELIDEKTYKEAYIFIYENSSNSLKYRYIKNGKAVFNSSIKVNEEVIEKLKDNMTKNGLLSSSDIKILQAQPGFERKDKDLMEHLSKKFGQQMHVMEEIKGYLDIICKISNNDQEKWNNGEWLQACQKNPIIWAMENNRKIDSIDPSEWIINNIVSSKQINKVIVNAFKLDKNGDCFSIIINRLNEINDQDEKQRLITLVIECYKKENDMAENILQKYKDILGVNVSSTPGSHY